MGSTNKDEASRPPIRSPTFNLDSSILVCPPSNDLSRSLSYTSHPPIKFVRIANVDCQIVRGVRGELLEGEKNLVIYAVNGLDSRFAKLVEIIRHREPLSTFETVRNMLLLKESSFNDDSGASTFDSSSSSPSILMATTASDNK
ncbi:hypothetical protein Tco_1338464, partial [Tanacetum coccineum]